ncbi:hypothetical protein NQ315_012504 [Exocentrus adspersus]|uniref:Uncharacterized protein n=1 Tax=Exocentrus adspersus TaxID=1586481 RepID=A0AAV8V8W7_9CUCU|nr:hypothetical protein NQ315_012504 [Exocentrus adspersus]
MGKDTLAKTLKTMNFTCGKVDRKSILIERYEIVAWRMEFLRKIRMFRNETKIWLLANQPLKDGPRSETVIEISILNTDITEGICPDIQITDGVYLAESIVKVNNDKMLTETDENIDEVDNDIVNDVDNNILLTLPSDISNTEPQYSVACEEVKHVDNEVNNCNNLSSDIAKLTPNSIICEVRKSDNGNESKEGFVEDVLDVQAIQIENDL